MWALIPQNIKDSSSLLCFKKESWKMEIQMPVSFMQNMFATCRVYIPQQLPPFSVFNLF